MFKPNMIKKLIKDSMAGAVGRCEGQGHLHAQSNVVFYLNNPYINKNTYITLR